MQVFIFEQLTSGALNGGEVSLSMLREGMAMLDALFNDVASIPECHPITIIDDRWMDEQSLCGHVLPASTPEEADSLFQTLIDSSHAVFLIAPETNGQLSQYTQQVNNSCAKLLGCNSHAVSLCGDKQMLSKHLLAHKIPTVPVYTVDIQQVTLNYQTHLPDFPSVLKPVDGAGAELTFLLKNEDDWRESLKQYQSYDHQLVPLCQSYITGESVSVSTLIDGDHIEIFPVALQNLSIDKQFEYRGGVIPHRVSALDSIHAIVKQTCLSIPGLSGFVGWDFIIPEQQPQHPQLIEINPRLTTSYVGYRDLAHDNIAERILFPSRFSRPILWGDNSVSFNTDGIIERMS